MTRKWRIAVFVLASAMIAGSIAAGIGAYRGHALREQRAQIERLLREVLGRMEDTDHGGEAMLSLFSDDFESPGLGNKKQVMAIMAEQRRRNHAPEDIDTTKAKILWKGDAVVAFPVVITFPDGIVMTAAFTFRNESGTWRIVRMEVNQG